MHNLTNTSVPDAESSVGSGSVARSLLAFLALAALVAPFAIMFHESGHYLAHRAFGYDPVTLSFSGVSVGPAPAGINSARADGLSFAAGAAASLALVLAALIPKVPRSLAAAVISFELVRGGIGLIIALSQRGVAAVWLGLGELRYVASAFGMPRAIGALFGVMEVAIPLIIAVYVLRRWPKSARISHALAALVGSIGGLALWLLVIGPRLLS